ncbi:DUF1178 family protein [uncultured Jannaschia sp.]|uniref:DUF1178 family protein n=1 Tax=uncultured Jannaschia sp. TaxID=293347 RepID=UPI0026118C72|nr:DUF1178 family protein [uncultured Jannaschia sp.]
MIRYALRCAEGHVFESWFQSAEAFDGLARRKMLTCTACGSVDVSKSLMAPKVGTRASEPQSPLEARIAAFRRKVETEATYVGGRFAEEARALHEAAQNEAKRPDKAIYGEANAREVRSLLEDGVPIAPLPFMPKAKTN